MNFVKPHKVSTHSALSDNCYNLCFFSWLPDWVEILWGFTKFIFKQMLKVSASYLEKQKSFIAKKNIFLAVVNIKTKKQAYCQPLSQSFFNPIMSILCSPQGDVGLLLHGCIIIINVIHDGGLLFANLSTNELHSPLCSHCTTVHSTARGP